MSEELIESYILDEARLSRTREAVNIAKTRSTLLGRLVSGSVNNDMSYTSGRAKFDMADYELTIHSYEVGSKDRFDTGTHGDQVIGFSAQFSKASLKGAEKHERAFLRGLKAVTKKAFKPLAKLGKVAERPAGGFSDEGTMFTVTVPAADSDKVIQAMGQAVKAWGVGLNGLAAKHSSIEGVGAPIESYVLGEASLSSVYKQTGDKAVVNYTDPKAAKKVIVLAAKGSSAFQFLRELGINHTRSVKGSTAAGAFPHEPNPKVSKMYKDLIGLFAGVREGLNKAGYASDERDDRMEFMLDRVRKGDLMERETVKSLLRQISKEWG